MSIGCTCITGPLCCIGDSGIGEESTNFIDENTDGRFYTEDENIHVLLEFSHKYV